MILQVQLPGEQDILEESFAEVSASVVRHIAENGVPKQDWTGGMVFHRGGQVAGVSYDGVVWPHPRDEARDVPLYDPRLADGFLFADYAWETGHVEVPGHGTVHVRASRGGGKCYAMETGFKVGGEDHFFDLRIETDGSGIPELETDVMYRNGRTVTMPKAVHDAVAFAVAGWYVMEADGIVMRNALKDALREMRDATEAETDARLALTRAQSVFVAKNAKVEALLAEMDPEPLPTPGM